VRDTRDSIIPRLSNLCSIGGEVARRRARVGRIFTIGHSTRTFDEFAELLSGAGVEQVADVRRLPGSSAHPQFDAETLAPALARLGIRYRHHPQLGGRRPRNHDIPPEVNGLWNNRSFHNYADHALTDEFRGGLVRLREEARDHRVAIMCSEAVWWRCHRRIIADHLLARGDEVLHIMAGGRTVPAGLTPGAVIGEGGAVTYPA
jgi:uncharacterized protein (DUF488 family)